MSKISPFKKTTHLLTCTTYSRENKRTIKVACNYNEMATVPKNEKAIPKQATKAQAAARDTVINV